MRKFGYGILLALICLVALGCGFASIIVIMFSSSFGVDIDYTDAQRQAAESRSWIFVLLGSLGLLGSLLLLFASDGITRLVLRIFGAGELE